MKREREDEEEWVYSEIEDEAEPTMVVETVGSNASKEEHLQKLLDKAEIFSEFISDNNNANPSEEKVIAQPKILNGTTLHPYQLDGMNWLISLYKNGTNGILADEMGLGKTCQTIAFLCFLIENNIRGPFLVLGPLSTIGNWQSEFSRFAPNVQVELYHGEKDSRVEKVKKLIHNEKKHKNSELNVNVVITSYDIALRDSNYLRKITWKYLVVDEGHRLKNMECKLFQVLKTFHAENRLLLTGTPLQNSLCELWSLLNFVMPDVFESLELFKSWFAFDNLHNKEVKTEILNQEKNNEIVTKLHKILKPFVLRRIKTDVGIDLPEKREILIFSGMSKMQNTLYEAALNGNLFETIRSLDKKKVTGSAGKYGQLQSLVVQLRKIVNHPYLFNAVDEYSLKQLIADSGKFIVIDSLLPGLLERGHKVLFFSQMTRVLDIVQDYLDEKGVRHARIDGAVPLAERQQLITDFNTQGSALNLMLVSTRAGGLGINLASADTVIIFDSDWNPQVDLQAQDRAHRIGQSRPVCVYRLLTAGSIEEYIHDRAQGKRLLEKLVMARGKFINPTASEEGAENGNGTIHELKTLFSEIDAPSDAKTTKKPISKKAIDKIVDREYVFSLSVSDQTRHEGFEYIQNQEVKF